MAVHIATIILPPLRVLLVEIEGKVGKGRRGIMRGGGKENVDGPILLFAIHVIVGKCWVGRNIGIRYFLTSFGFTQCNVLQNTLFL